MGGLDRPRRARLPPVGAGLALPLGVGAPGALLIFLSEIQQRARQLAVGQLTGQAAASLCLLEKKFRMAFHRFVPNELICIMFPAIPIFVDNAIGNLFHRRKKALDSGSGM